MYTSYFGFREKPFTLTPNPRFIFLSNNHKEAFAHLLYGINNRYGFIALTGEVGTGKTTVLRTMLGQLSDDVYRKALIFSPSPTGVELLHNINTEFGLPAASGLANELLAELNDFLLAENTAGRTVVLVIDEAQNLLPEVLEQIRLISNLETENDKLIQIILAGQPELEILLGRRDLRQLNQRIAVRYRLGPMTRRETRAYIKQRMEVAGETGGVAFSSLSLALIHLFSRGTPRMINILCDRSLLTAYGDERRLITVWTVIRSFGELLNRSQVRRLAVLTLAAGLLICLFVMAGLFRWKPAIQQMQRSSERSAQIRENTTTPSVSAATVTESAVTRLKREIATYDQNDTHVQAFNALAEAWGVRPIKHYSEGLDVPDTFRSLAARRNLRVTLFRGSLDDVAGFNLPFLALTSVTGSLGEYAYAVTAAGNDTMNISPALFGDHTIAKHDLAAVTNGTYYLVWYNTGQIPSSIANNERRAEIKVLQKMLQRAGVYQGAISGIYTPETVTAIRSFQAASRIAVNDGPGELTLALLSRFGGSRKIPFLKGS